ncbi:MAG: hypothetical protein R6X12_03085 [bacterium]
MRNPVLAILAAVAALACLSCDQFEGDADFFPTAVGSSWRYEAEMVLLPSDTILTQVTNLRVTGTAPLGAGGTAAVFVTTDSLRQRVPWDTLLVNSDTSWILKDSRWVLDFDGPNDDKPDTMLVLPLELNKTWQVLVKADTTVWGTVVKRENITVPAGTFADCWAVEYEYSYTGGSYKLTHWYAEEVGWVRGWSEFTAGNYTGRNEQRLTGYDVK